MNMSKPSWFLFCSSSFRSSPSLSKFLLMPRGLLWAPDTKPRNWVLLTDNLDSWSPTPAVLRRSPGSWWTRPPGRNATSYPDRDAGASWVHSPHWGPLPVMDDKPLCILLYAVLWPTQFCPSLQSPPSWGHLNFPPASSQLLRAPTTSPPLPAAATLIFETFPWVCSGCMA